MFHPAVLLVYLAAFVVFAIDTYWRPAYGLAGLMLVIPFAFAREFGPTTVTLSKVALPGIALGLLCKRASTSVLLDRRVALILAAALAIVVMTAFSFAQAHFKEPVLRETLKACEYLGAFIIALLSYRADPDQRLMQWTIFGLAAVVSLLALRKSSRLRPRRYSLAVTRYRVSLGRWKDRIRRNAQDQADAAPAGRSDAPMPRHLACAADPWVTARGLPRRGPAPHNRLFPHGIGTAMRLLVTGGLGFIGSHFIRLMLSERPDASVVNFDAMTYAGNPANCADLESDNRYRFIKGDICDAGAVGTAIGGGVDAIVNFAAETHVDRSILDPEAFLRTDILGTHVLLGAVRKHSVARYLQVSTDEVYGHAHSGESTEDDPLRPRSPYSASKAGGDLQVLAYWTTFHTPVLITRGLNTYGPHQHPEKVIPVFITNLIDNQPVPVYGDGMQIRDWIHVEDHARGILHVLEHGELGSIYNIGGAHPRTNLDITKILVSQCSRSTDTHVRHVSDRPGHDSPIRARLHEGSRVRMDAANLFRARSNSNDFLVHAQ